MRGDEDPFHNLMNVPPFGMVRVGIPGVPIGAEGGATSIALGDVDGDGDLDLVTGGSTTLTLFLSDGDLTPFDTVGAGIAISVAAGLQLREVVLGDVTGDGDLDLIVRGRDSIRLYVNDGDSVPFDSAGTGTSIGDHGDDGVSPSSIALGDINGDGDVDVVVGRDLFGGGRSYYHLNDGEGDPFDTAGLITPFGLETEDTQVIALADMDGDGDLDLVTGNDEQVNRLYVNDGSRRPFLRGETGTTIGTDADDPLSVAVGDVDGDGDLDVVAGNDGGRNRLYLNDGDSLPFNTATQGDAIGTDEDVTHAIVLGDVDRDGDLDVIAGNRGQTNKLYLNDGTGAPFAALGAGTAIGSDTHNTEALVLGDFDGDGDLDLVAGNYQQTNRLYLNDGTAAPFASAGGGQAFGTNTENTRALVAGDVDRDGDLDLVAGHYIQRNALYLNDGDGEPFDSATGMPIGTDTAATLDIALGDVDGDGDLDVVAGNNLQANKLYLNDGDGAPFDAVGAGEVVGTEEAASYGVALGDVNGDGRLDLIVANADRENRLYVNDGAGMPFDSGFAEAALGTNAEDSRAIALGDMDGNGSLDAVVGIRARENKLFLNGRVGAPYVSPGEGAPIDTEFEATWAIQLGDVDGDGDLDVVAGNFEQPNRLYLNDGSGNPFHAAGTGAGDRLGCGRDVCDRVGGRRPGRQPGRGRGEFQSAQQGLSEHGRRGAVRFGGGGLDHHDRDGRDIFNRAGGCGWRRGPGRGGRERWPAEQAVFERRVPRAVRHGDCGNGDRHGQ